MAATGRNLAAGVETWLQQLRDKESRGEIMEMEILQAAEALNSAAKLMISLSAHVEALEGARPASGGGAGI